MIRICPRTEYTWPGFPARFLKTGAAFCLLVFLFCFLFASASEASLTLQQSAVEYEPVIFPSILNLRQSVIEYEPVIFPHILNHFSI